MPSTSRSKKRKRGRNDLTQSIFTFGSEQLFDNFSSCSTNRDADLVLDTSQNSNTNSRNKRRNMMNTSFLYVLDTDGTFRLGRPTDSTWWINYVLLPPDKLTPRQRERFRDRFRVPYDYWKDFVMLLAETPDFSQWKNGSKTVCGKDSAPLELLSLGALRYIGRKCTFDDLMEITFISRRTHCRFFKTFIHFGSTTLYATHVKTPCHENELGSQIEMMIAAGFPGGLASTDATNVPMDSCDFGSRQTHKGYKLNRPCRTYNLSALRSRRIISSTGGHPSRWNDQSIVWFDDFVMNLKSGKSFLSNIFYLYEYDSDGRVVQVAYRGGWLLTDNGYHDWAVTIPPYKRCTNIQMVRWSQWVC